MISFFEKFKIIITTRSSILYEELNSEEAKEIYLEPFNEKESIEFIKKCFGVKEEESKELLKLLEPSDELKRPNDLIKLKAYVELNRNGFQKISIKFINDLNEKRQKTKIQISDDEIFELIIKKYRESWDILKYSTYLDPDFIPIEIYSDLFGLEQNKLAIEVEKFKEISIISVDNKDDENIGLKIHRTIKFGIENYLNKNQSEENFDNDLIEKFTKLIKLIKKNETKKKRKYFLHLKTTVDKFLSNEKQTENVKTMIASTFGDYLKDTDFRNEDALTYYQKAIYFININRNYNQNEKERNLTNIFKKKGEVLLTLGKYNEANEILLKSLKINRNEFRKDEHVDIAETLNNIGGVLYKQGKYEEALEYLNKSLEIYRKLFGTDEHAEVAKTLNNIGLVLKSEEKYEEALEHYNKSLEIKKKLFSTEEHEDTAVTLTNIGLILKSQGKYEEALEHYNKSLKIYREVFGTDEHEDTAVTLNNIGLVLNIQGKFEEALEQFRKSLEIYRKVFETDEHAHIARILNNVGSVYLSKGKYDEALEQFRKSLEIYRKLYGSDEHPHIARMLKIIGFVLNSQGK